MNVLPLRAAIFVLAFISLKAFAAATYYVSTNSLNPVPPYSSWATAATNIQNAIDAANTSDFIIVSNGVYGTGGHAVYGTLINRVALDKAVTVQSVNGPASTTIQGFTSAAGPTGIRCAYLTNGAVLSGFTLANGSAGSGDPFRDESGGGVWCESVSAVVSNCVIMGNSPLEYGGGAFNGTLLNCQLTNNTSYFGGGACSNTFINCTLVHNFANYQNLTSGGGAIYCILTNCVITGNRCYGGGGGANYSMLTGCVVSKNSGINGGGVCVGLINNCLIVSNSALYGGGSYSNTLVSCVLNSNSVGQYLGASGGGAYGSVLINCALTNNSASGAAAAGGGACMGTLLNCTVVSNTATSGGGACSNTLVNCLLRNNTAASSGGGAFFSTLFNCTVVGNTATSGGGVTSGAVTNSIVYDNNGGNIFNTKLVAYTCCFPNLNSVGGFTNPPLFINAAGGNYHLNTNSPCINSGYNAWVNNNTDLDGNPRTSGGTVDLGAYEFQSPASIISYTWLQQYGLPTDGSADYLDSDGTGMNNWQKWIAGLNPTNPASVLAMLPLKTNSVGMVVSWHSVTTRTYYVQRATDLANPAAYSVIRSNLVGQLGSTSFTDTTATNGGPYFYRVGVQ